MAIYYAQNKFVFDTAGQNTVQPIYNAISDTPVVGVFNPAVALAAGDVIHMLTLPPYVMITSALLDVDALDSGTALQLEVGTLAAPASIVAAGAAGQSSRGSLIPANVGGLLALTFTVPTDIVVTCTAAAAGALLTGNIRLRVNYSAVT